MTTTLWLIIFSYVFIAGLLILILINSSISYLLKLPMIILMAVFIFISYHSWKEAQGWPTASDIPDKFLLHASVIDEPDSQKREDGSIFIWATDLKSQRPADEPRAYILAYDQEVHSALEDALLNMRKGNIQIGSRKIADVDNAPAKDFSRLGEKRITLEFSNLPDPALPEK